MTDDYTECLKTICDFPTIYKTGGKSPRDILRQSGYFELFNEVTEEKIIVHLNSYPELIDTWLLFTEEIRYQPAWGLIDGGKSKWTVFFTHVGEKVEFT
ncbi:MAG TPA: hypothetical protein VEW65_06330, partial [Chryseolinea sp.]|nr:hypothetical protein [Chryseolinea sp.]